MDTKFVGTIGIVVLGIVVIGLSVWYMATHPAPVTPLGQIATSTPPGAQHLSDHGKYYDIDAVYPGSTPLAASVGADADAAAVTAMKGFIQNQIDAFKEQNKLLSLTPEDVKIQGLDQGRKYDLEVTYETQNSPRTVSYIYTMYADTLGAHPNGYYRTFTYDLKTGEGIELGDIFQPTVDYPTLLSQISRAKLPAQIAQMENVSASEIDGQMLKDGTTPDADNFQTWYLDGTDLIIIFPPYQVGPYVLGTVTLTIPRSELGSVLKPEYGG
jgi:hypothetical protein